jgi:hypothetical protein
LGFNPELCYHIVFLYDATTQSNAFCEEMRNCLLGTLHSLLCFGLIQPSLSKYDDNEDDAIQYVMDNIQRVFSEQGDDGSTCISDLLQWESRSNHVMENGQEMMICNLLDSTFSSQVHAQKEYLFQILSTFRNNSRSFLARADPPRNPDEKRSTSKDATDKVPSSSSTMQRVSGTDRLISKLRELFPSYGEGYLEAALACYHQDVERTTSALIELQSNPNNQFIHPRLKVLDPNLPSRRKGGKERYDDFETKEDLEAKEIQKSRMREMQIQRENEAYLLSAAMGEYNDEYDDQYDGIGEGEDGVGGMDTGLYDADYEAIKTYNRVAREIESDRLFWEETKNTNTRKKKYGDKNTENRNSLRGNGVGPSFLAKDEMDGFDKQDEEDGDDERKYKGPNKGKGGRIIGPDGKYLPLPKHRKKGGNMKQAEQTDNENGNTQGKGSNQVKNIGDSKSKTSADEMTKLQKRRKNDNKAKIANHHRKERSLKKSGM